MPIADDIKEFYPDDWQDVRRRVLERAAGRGVTEHGHPCWTGKETCEWCGKPNGEKVWVVPGGEWSQAGYYWADAEGANLGYRLPDMPNGKNSDEARKIKVVLTVAHLDQDPRSDDVARLRALCQYCHLTYDQQPKQRAHRQRIYAELRGQGTLLGGAED